MASKFLQRLTLAAVLIGGLGLVEAQTATARPVRRTARAEAARGFNLFAGSVNVVMNVNRIQCNINNIGEQCVDPTNSPVVGGGFWPKGTPDQYIFNGGLQVAAIIPGTKATFAWSQDTVGAYFFDARGDQAAGQGLTNVYSSLNEGDLAEWPTAAYVSDPTVFNSALLGRKTASQQDTWVRYWDGNVNLLTGRQHPMGLLVDQRGMMWNFPSGNQDIVYFLIRFINISAASSQAARYAGLAQYGYSAADIAEIMQIADNFRAASQAKFNITIPDTGYWLDRMYAGYGQDPDLGSSGVNYSTGNLPFSMAYVYKADFREPTWAYPPDIFGAPFAPTAPGLSGVKYLKSPADANGDPYGITMLTNTTNGGEFTDRFGVQALWRLASNNLQSQDGACNSPINTPLCRLVQTYADTRIYMYSGPMTIKPGESAIIVVGIVHAATVAAHIQVDNVTPQHSLGSTAFDLKPGWPGTPTGYVSASSRDGQTTRDTIRQIDRASGWNSATADVSALDANADGVLEQTEIPTVPRSLLNKSLVAQAVFDANFLLPFAPEAPKFFMIPGDHQVTVVWEPTSTESNGDPYFAVASDPMNSLYDPNFRRYDVEGYRIWKGRTQAEMEVIAAYDYAGTYMADYTGSFWNSDYGLRCAPELGITSSCPATFQTSYPYTGNYRVSLAGQVVQVPPGGRVQLASGDVLIVAADTAVVGGNSRLPELQDTGVPFAYVDNNVRNGFRYYYAVTAFDVNSVKSGPSSLESPLVSKAVTPRVNSGQETAGSLGTPELVGGNGAVLDPTAALPTINAATGIFSGPAPATNAMDLGFVAFLPQVLGTGNVTVTLDSVIPGSTLTNTRNAFYWFTGVGAGAPVRFSVPILGAGDYPETVHDGSAPFPAAGFSGAKAARFGGDSTYALYGNVTLQVGGAWGLTMKGRGDANGHPTGPHNGPRWWTGTANENTDDPNAVDCYAQMGSYACTLADLSRNSGAIAGVDIFGIRSYHTVGTSGIARDIEGVTATVFRAADIKWYWGANGAVDSVVDVTHRVRVPFNPLLRAGWGILNDSSFVAATAASTYDRNNGLLTWTDMSCVEPLPAYLGYCGAAGTAVMQDHARLSPVAFQSGTAAATRTMTTNGDGFILYLNGHFFLMRMAALPAAGTVWNVRFYAGNVTGYAGSYAFQAAVRPAAVPGLRMRVAYQGGTADPSVTTDSSLARVHTVPDPYYVTNALEITANTKVLRFVNLPSQAIIRIYSVSGVLVNVLTHNDAGSGGEEVWNLRNRNNQFVASGVYFYHVETPDGRTKIGRFTVVNYAQ